MPLQTSLLDDGNFVLAPESAPKPAFFKYLDYADRLLGQWTSVCEAWKRQPLSPELGAEKRELDAAEADFRATFLSRYGAKHVELDSAFWPVSKWFAACRPVDRPFSILHADAETPLHTVCRFETDHELARLNSALDEDTPLVWWRTGMHNRRCYLFGTGVWELAASEVEMSETGIVLLFQGMLDARQQRRDRLLRGSPSAVAAATAAVVEFVPPKTRTAVWRRARGKCEQCGGLDGLDFTVAATHRGPSDSPQNIQLLCNRCRETGNAPRR